MKRILGTVLLLAVCSGLPGSGWAAEIRVVIDPAHGGSDSGSRAGNVLEKDWNLRFAKAIAQAARAAGLEPILVRDRDETLEMKERLDRINSSDAIVAIILHADRELTGTKRGPFFVVQPPTAPSDPPGILPWGWVPNGRHRAAVRFAKSLARAVGVSPLFQGLSDRSGILGETPSWDGGILCASHAHLRYVTLPAVVVTPLFLTSKQDLVAFQADEAVDAFAVQVIEGLKNHLHSAAEDNS